LEGTIAQSIDKKQRLGMTAKHSGYSNGFNFMLTPA
jgi:hypothetical protein